MLIARNKQQRSMTSAFGKYKAKLQKAAEGMKTRLTKRTGGKESFVAAQKVKEKKMSRCYLDSLMI